MSSSSEFYQAQRGEETREARIRENAAVFDFELSAEDPRVLDGLNEDLHTSWDPSDVP